MQTPHPNNAQKFETGMPNRGIFRGGKGGTCPLEFQGQMPPHIFGSKALHYTAPLRYRFRSNNYIFLRKIEPISFELKMIGLMIINLWECPLCVFFWVELVELNWFLKIWIHQTLWIRIRVPYMQKHEDLGISAPRKNMLWRRLRGIWHRLGGIWRRLRGMWHRLIWHWLPIVCFLSSFKL